MKKLKDVDLFLLDMDGTIYLGDSLIEGASEFLQAIKEKNKSYLFLTNNSSKNSMEYVEKLRRLGIGAKQEEIFTSGQATAIYLNKKKAGAKIFLLGTPALVDEFVQAGFTVTDKCDEKVDFVVLGFDTTLTYQKLWAACDYIRDGVPYYATHPDINCPLAEGRVMPDTGAMIAFIKAATGYEPMVIGKPNAAIVEAVAKRYGVNKERMAMVGDRLYTDIRLGSNAGIVSVLVFTGETTRKDYQESVIRSNYTFASVADIIPYL